jgi:hypothetical protein
MNFMTKALNAAFGPKTTIIGQLRENLSGKVPARSHEQVHASDLTKPDFCPREVALLHATKGKRKDQFVDTALKVTFDIGNMTSDLIREKWLAGQAVGDWWCSRCGAKRAFCKLPPDTDQTSPHVHHWHYREVKFEALGFTGSIDMFVDLGAPRLTVVELKIMAPDEWIPLVAPKAEHRVRTNLYLRLIEASDHPMKDRINLTKAKVMYVTRSFGKAHPEYGGDILPFKEFDLPRDDSAIADALDKSEKIQLFLKSGIFPKRTCDTSWGPVAKNCSACAACFSGKFP